MNPDPGESRPPPPRGAADAAQPHPRVQRDAARGRGGDRRAGPGAPQGPRRGPRAPGGRRGVARSGSRRGGWRASVGRLASEDRASPGPARSEAVEPARPSWRPRAVPASVPADAQRIGAAVSRLQVASRGLDARRGEGAPRVGATQRGGREAAATPTRAGGAPRPRSWWSTTTRRTATCWRDASSGRATRSARPAAGRERSDRRASRSTSSCSTS